MKIPKLSKMLIKLLFISDPPCSCRGLGRESNPCDPATTPDGQTSECDDGDRGGGGGVGGQREGRMRGEGRYRVILLGFLFEFPQFTQNI